MKGFIFLSALIPVVLAHTRFTTLFVNGQSQGDGTCIRMDMSPLTTTFWVSSITSADMACGKDGGPSVDRTCPLKPGDSISLQHRVWPDGTNPGAGAIDPRHKGSTAVYMKKLADAGSTDPYSTSASGDGWFKIAWNGYDNNQWGTDKMIANDGKVDAAIPSDLSSGYYLVRSEILALQNVTNDKVAPQFYVGCAQVYVDTSKSGDVATPTVSIPGYIDGSEPGLNYNIYQSTPPAVPYMEFGPKAYGSVSARAVEGVAARSPRFRVDGFRHPSYIWSNIVDESTSSGSGSGSGNAVDIAGTTTNAGSTVVATSTAGSTIASSLTNSAVKSSSPSTSSTKSASTSQSTTGSSSSTGSNLSIVGTCPSNTVLTVANSCLTELPSWSGDATGALPKCWAASKQCWDMSSNCWKTISPAVNVNDMNAGCHAWENKCNALDDWCHAGNLEGPPAWNGGNVKTAKKGKRDVARHVVAAKRRGLRR